MCDSSDFASRGSVRCPVPVRVSVLVLVVPSAFATIKGLKGLKRPKGILADDSEDSSDFASRGVRCPVPVRVSDSVLSVPSAFATIKGLTGLKGPKGILSDDSGLFCGRVVVDDAFECGDEVIVG